MNSECHPFCLEPFRREPLHRIGKGAFGSCRRSSRMPRWETRMTRGRKTGWSAGGTRRLTRIARREADMSAVQLGVKTRWYSRRHSGRKSWVPDAGCCLRLRSRFGVGALQMQQVRVHVARWQSRRHLLRAQEV